MTLRHLRYFDNLSYVFSKRNPFVLERSQAKEIEIEIDHHGLTSFKGTVFN